MIQKKILNGLKILMVSLFFISCSNDDEETNLPVFEERVIIANRASGSISFIDAVTNQVVSTLDIPGSEPMYVVYVPKNDKIYVGDRKSNKVHVVDPQTKMVENSITVGNGIFHMWANESQLWVNNDIDKTISVIDLATNAVIKTINVGITPHDIFLTKDGTNAYISVFNPDPNLPDSIYSYSTKSFEKTGEQNVGKDPHLFHLPSGNTLFVACITGEFYALNGNNLAIISNKNYEGAHGIFPSPDQNTLFVGNFPGAQLYSINAATSTINGSPLNTSNPIPHNIVVNESGTKMFVTHSGASSTTVSTYTVSSTTFTASSNITVGRNPFGIAYYKREMQ